MIALASASAGWGCAGDGLSPRERPQAFSDTIYDGGGGASAGRRPAPTAAPADGTVPPPPPGVSEPAVVPRLAVRGPISVAVVQMGEVAPPDAAIRAFLGRPDLFSKVDPLAGRIAPDGMAGDGRAAADDLVAYRTAAGNLGDDYVLVYGGTLDHKQVSLPWSILNLTIVGAFLLPSEQVTVVGRAAGTLVDVRTGRMGFGVAADARATSLQPAVSAWGVREPLTEAVVCEMQDKLIARTQQQVAAARVP